MPETLTVHLNREEPRDVAPEVASLETDRSFVLRFVNHGGPLHVHLHFDEALDAVAQPSATQVYVDEEATRDVEITIPLGHGPAKGYVDLVTGYGAQEARLNVTVTAERKDGGPEVAVDETLAEKQTVETDPGGGTAEGARNLVLAAGGVVVAAAVALAVSDSLALVVGVLALLAGVAAAAYLLFV
ncbi:DUF7524 family protein [Halobacterium wangiae]|uniref:DUF7524 family protein n=1 Tax=Halobacterium wangiae TaxID=2902623 RepID=UPI001E617E80|nr:hypothetical protein [Halobacterium wangiae]